MARLCERPGCSDRADVSYGFDAELLVVWLDGFQFAQGARSGVLCRRHADAMVVPLGWMLDDRRDPVPRLFKAPELATDRVAPRKRRSVKAPVVEQLRFDVIDDAESAVAGPVVVESAVAEPVVVELAVVEPTATRPTIELPIPIDTLDSPESESEPEPEPEPVPELAPVELAPVDVAEVSPAPEPVAPWQPVFDQQDDLKGLLNARGRLLSRAFTGFGDAANN